MATKTNEPLTLRLVKAKRKLEKAKEAFEELRAELLQTEGAGFKSDDGVQIVAQPKLIVDGALEKGLAAIGRLGEAQTLKVDGGKVKALAKTDERVQALMQFKESLAVRVKI
jgi:hypothetical protein